jgi:hypothetical protein
MNITSTALPRSANFFAEQHETYSPWLSAISLIERHFGAPARPERLRMSFGYKVVAEQVLAE